MTVSYAAENSSFAGLVDVDSGRNMYFETCVVLRKSALGSSGLIDDRGRQTTG